MPLSSSCIRSGVFMLVVLGWNVADVIADTSSNQSTTESSSSIGSILFFGVLTLLLGFAIAKLYQASSSPTKPVVSAHIVVPAAVPTSSSSVAPLTPSPPSTPSKKSSTSSASASSSPSLLSPPRSTRLRASELHLRLTTPPRIPFKPWDSLDQDEKPISQATQKPMSKKEYEFAKGAMPVGPFKKDEACPIPWIASEGVSQLLVHGVRTMDDVLGKYLELNDEQTFAAWLVSKGIDVTNAKRAALVYKDKVQQM